MESGTKSARGRAQRVIVEVRYSVTAQKGVLEPGGALRVGRLESADIAIPSDENISAAHFEIT